ncbi:MULTISPECIES: helix-turn-helix domain-containing protein [Actinoplanes]|uniref:XRE family transcriptional regulator n=2 Tax=Actinoplanes TaxID=1865 RepID=A0A0X3VAA5_9ACTN|nr:MULTISPECIES: helix-turn-helix domain-containing protein [Actinoplanes]KUL41723.1 XRE family transcriptional regulator [Actinoplanes awajinensis subsp. mycoplanecinus]GIE68673.1 XRE family transcriptional regulator [Actinoplanes palleronii]
MAGTEGVFSIAEKLDRLFRTTGEPSHMTVAEAIRDKQGVPISHTYIWQLRTGRRDNPTLQHLTALAGYFGVPVAYFLDDQVAAGVDAQLALLRSLRAAGVTEIALRAADVSPRGREAISEAIRQVWEAEHGPQPPG